MKTRHVLLLIFALLFSAGWQANLRAQDIPTNYIQNPNMEHDLNAIFWYGSWDPIYGSDAIATRPSEFMTNEDSHSGNWSMYVMPGSYIWVSYPVRGHEEKKFKASFWYKGYFESYWNFIYRDVGMTFEDLHPSLAEYTGADTALWGGEGQDALQFLFGGDDGYTEDWTYFEFVWDFPGTISGWGNTSMWYATYDPAYIDDLYYGEWYDGQYSGEEEFGIVNGDFELQELNTEWLMNLASWDLFLPSDFISTMENHTDAGFQSIGLIDYMQISDEGDTTEQDRNITYYLPALGAEDENMELSFWHKGSSANIILEFYDDYGISPETFAVPEGASLVLDMDNPVYELDTLSVNVDTIETFIDTFTVADGAGYEQVMEMYIDTMTLNTETELVFQNFDDEENLTLTDDAWVWSGSEFYEYNDWAAATKADEAWSDPESLWLPGDPNWGGAEGYVDVEDNTSYIFEFMYKGRLQFILNLGADAKYDLVGDPEGIVPAEATADASAITWVLDSDYWRKFRFEYTQGTWLADSAVEAPASLSFDLIGTYTDNEVGYVDDFMVATGTVADPVVVDTLFVVIDENYTIETTYNIDTLSTTYPDKGVMWEIPATDEWTEWKYTWTNPSTDIGGTLTMMLDNEMSDTPPWVTPENPQLDPAHSDWTYFDDFFYGVAEPGGINPVKYDLHIYPNPVEDMLYMSIMKPLERVDVYNSLGQLVIAVNHPERKLNVSELQTGIYFLNVTDESGIVHKAKFLKR